MEMALFRCTICGTERIWGTCASETSEAFLKCEGKKCEKAFTRHKFTRYTGITIEIEIFRRQADDVHGRLKGPLNLPHYLRRASSDTAQAFTDYLAN